jgi:hypothetical protein
MAEIIQIDGPGAASQVEITAAFDEIFRVSWPEGSTDRRDVVIAIDKGEDSEIALIPNYGSMGTVEALIGIPKANDDTGNTFRWTVSPGRDGCMPTVQVRVRTKSAPSATTKVSVSAS